MVGDDVRFSQVGGSSPSCGVSEPLEVDLEVKLRLDNVAWVVVSRNVTKC